MIILKQQTNKEKSVFNIQRKLVLNKKQTKGKMHLILFDFWLALRRTLNGASTQSHCIHLHIVYTFIL